MCGNYHRSDLEPLLPLVNLVMMDLTHMGPVAHRAAIGVTNTRILAIAEHLMSTDMPVWFRTLGARTGAQVGLPGLELLRFHRLAADQYRSLGPEYRVSELEALTLALMGELRTVARDYEIEVKGT